MTVVLFVLAACLAVGAEVMLTRANPRLRLSLWREAPLTPMAARVLTGLAIGLALFGAITLGDQIAWWWGPPLIGGAFLPAALLRLLHNAREPASDRR